jgi:16S rRNA processing protein RimM
MKAVEMTDVFLARVVKAFGIRGELKLDPAEDFWEGVLRSRNLVLRTETEDGSEERSFVVERYRPHGSCWVVEVAGVGDRDRAEELVGSDVLIDRSRIDVDLPFRRLPFQVVGSEVRSEDGRVLGEVTGVLFSPAHELYEVTGKAGTFLVPAVPEFVVAVDDDRKAVVIRTIPGLVSGEGEVGGEDEK